MSLMYHDVFHLATNESGFQNISAISYKLQSCEFEQQISMIAEFYESRKMDKNQIALTFDDGGESIYSIITPILEKYSFKGYFFIITSFIGRKGFLNREQIINLHHRGHFIGAHSHTHPENLTVLSAEEIEKEWSVSIEMLNEIVPEKIKVASIPNGFYSEESRIALYKKGIEMIFTSTPTFKTEHNSDNQDIIGRFPIKKNIKKKFLIQLMKHNSVIMIREIIKWRGLAIARFVLGNYYYLIRKALLKILIEMKFSVICPVYNEEK